MNMQETFDKVAEHLLKQNKKSLLPLSNDCAYRGEDGTMCAIGVLIPDEMYDKRFEGGRWTVLPRKVIDHITPDDSTDHPHGNMLLSALQTVHDMHPPDGWPAALSKVASRYGLDGSIVGQLE